MNVRKIFQCLAILLISHASSVAQLSSGEFLLGGTNGDVGQSIVQAPDGGYAIAGYTNSIGKNATNMYVVKLDSTAKIQWTRVISDTIEYCASYGTSIITTKDNGYVIIGYESNVSSGLFFVKIDSAGNLSWTKTYLGKYYWALGNSIIQTNDGGYAITGSNVSETSNSSILILKLDSFGNILWSNNLTTSKEEYPEDEGYQIIQTNDHGYVVAGTLGNGTGYNFYVAKLDSNGTMQWGKTTDNDGVAYSVIQTYDNNLIILSSGTQVYKVGINGNFYWSKNIYIDSNINLQGCCIKQTTDHGLVFIANTAGSICLVKMDSLGNIKWSKLYGGGYTYPWSYGLSAYSFVQTKDKGFAIIGDADSSIVDSSSAGGILFLKVDSLGRACSYDSLNVTFTKGDSLYNNDSSFTNTWTTRSECVLDTGGSETSICFTYITGVKLITPVVGGIDIFPNPNNGQFTIQLSTFSGPLSVEIYNVLGEKVFIKSTIQTPTFNIDLSSQPNGVYLYRVLKENGELLGEGKVIVEK